VTHLVLLGGSHLPVGEAPLAPDDRPRPRPRGSGGRAIGRPHPPPRGGPRPGLFGALEDRIPSKGLGALGDPGGDDPPPGGAHKEPHPLAARGGAGGEGKDGGRRGPLLVRISRQQVDQSLSARLVEEPLDVDSRKAVQRVEAEGGVLDEAGAADGLGGAAALVAGDVGGVALGGTAVRMGWMGGTDGVEGTDGIDGRNTPLA